MSSLAQAAANAANARHSTGPRTEQGKAKSSRNSVVLGLFSGDFIRPGEQADYQTLEAGLHADLAPAGALEEIFFLEILRASWRLRRCGLVETHLASYLGADPVAPLDTMETNDECPVSIQKSVDRARSQAHRLLCKALAELRKLQTDRYLREQSEDPEPSVLVRTPVAGSAVARRTQSAPSATPRNSPCPCGSGQKHKRCCGRAGSSAPALPPNSSSDAPPELRAA